MYYENIVFPHGVPLEYEGWSAGTYHLHAHKDVIEILMVIKGKATVTVSCETFEMDEGDYAVIKDQDAHMFTSANSGCEIVSLYLNMETYVDKIPYLYYVIFGCESFDLAKYRNETAKIRRLIVSIIINLIRNDEYGKSEAMKVAEELLWLLVKDYDMVKYYNRKWDAPFVKVEKYYKIMGYIFNYYYMKNIREYISTKEFYSKSYITHLFKDVGATSFKDMLDYVRIFKSQELLIITNLSINDISFQCGFSDVKYYTANFKKWFLCTPSEYRKSAINQVNKKSIYHQLEAPLITEVVKGFLLEEKEDSHYRAAVTPLSLKAFAHTGQSFLFKNREAVPELAEREKHTLSDGSGKHYLPIRIEEEMLEWEEEQLVKYIQSYDNCFYCPVLIIEWGISSESKVRMIIERYLQSYEPVKSGCRVIYLIYYDLGDYKSVSKIVMDFLVQFENVEIRPMLLSR